MGHRCWRLLWHDGYAFSTHRFARPCVGRRVVLGWVDSERARTGFGLAFFLAVAITAAAIWLVAVAPGATSGSARGSSSQIALIVLAANLLLISGLAIIVGRRVLTLVRSTTKPGRAFI
jgi:hypothetical protein